MTHFPNTFFAIACAALVGQAAAAAEGDYTITLTDGVITPQQIEVPAGASVTLTVSNTGTTPAEFESKQLHIEQVVAPGMTAAIALPALPAGSYRFVEEYHEDQATGRGVIVAK